MREYMSQYNPMKLPEQRERFSKNNPMKTPKIAEKVGLKHSKAIIIGEQEFNSLIEASNFFQVSDTTIGNWCKKGINPQGQICKYKDGPTRGYNISQQKAIIIDEKFYFATIREAAEFLQCAPSNLGATLRKGKTTYKNHKCRYANQQPSQTNSLISSLEGSTTNG